jgi:AraC-like DNA-binding protein
MSYFCSTFFARLVVAAARQMGIPSDRIVEETGLTAILAKSTAKITDSQFSELWEKLKADSNDPCFGLHLGENTAGLYRNNIFYSFIKNLPCLLQVIQHVIKYHGILGSMLDPSMERKGIFTTFRETTRSKFVDRHQVEALLAAYAFVFKDILPDKQLLVAVNFQHDGDNTIEEYQRIFCCQVHFNQADNELLFASHDKLLQRLTLFDPTAARQLEPIILRQLSEMNAAETMSDQVAREVLNLMRLRKKPSLNSVARGMAVSTRLLQVHLQEEGVTYSQILENERKKLALEYISQHDADIFEINSILGFSDQSAFTRAFKQWTGHPPKQYKKKFVNTAIL